MALNAKQVPMPDPELSTSLVDRFDPSSDLEAWVDSCFIEAGSELENEDHAHLQVASIGYLWTNVANTKKGRTIIGMAELGKPQGAMGKWNRARAIRQVRDWFGDIPDYIITISAEWWVSVTDAERCALIEHELYHCAQDVDAFGAPKFSRDTGKPSFTVVGHDVEEFVGVVRRYGAEAVGIRDLVDAANAGPEIASACIARACGNCI